MSQATQNFKNHQRFLPSFHFFAVPVLLVNVFVQLVWLWGSPTLAGAWAVIVAIALFMTAILSRVQANTVQDRVIRLEMRLRLREILPADLKPRINDVTPRQLVALRFASDAELPELVREVLAGKLDTQKAIKTRIRDWQGDFLRA
jgi:hypothetical protein